jgi:hypothetical protein
MVKTMSFIYLYFLSQFKKKKKKKSKRTGWPMPVIPALGRLRQEDSDRPARTTQ